MPKLTLAERFLLCRRRMNLTQSEMAGMLRVSRLTVIRFEQGIKVNSRTRSAVDRFLILEKRQRELKQEKRRGLREASTSTV